MHISLVPPAGGVQAGHDDEVVHPVADVEQPKHCREIGIENGQSWFYKKGEHEPFNFFFAD